VDVVSLGNCVFWDLGKGLCFRTCVWDLCLGRCVFWALRGGPCAFKSNVLLSVFPIAKVWTGAKMCVTMDWLSNVIAHATRVNMTSLQKAVQIYITESIIFKQQNREKERNRKKRGIV
jgi:hypothetical protein